MAWFEPRRTWSTIRRAFMLPTTRARVEQRVDDELHFHLDERTDELVRDGLSRDEAAARVNAAFGSVDRVRREVLAIDNRRAKRASARVVIESLVQDAAFALRTLRRRPVFAATAIATLALGIGATTAMFTIVNGVLLRDLPYRDPARLVTIYTTFPYWKGQPVVGEHWNTLRTPFPDYQNLIKSQRTFEGVAGFQISSASLSLGRESISIAEGFGTANLLPLLGVSPMLGRWFLPGEDGPAASRLAVLSHAVWLNRFAGDSTVLGRTVDIDEEPFTVVGVLPAGFDLTARPVETNAPVPADVWLPFGVYPDMLTPNNHTLELIARLKPGISRVAALADAEPLLRGDRPATRRGARIELRDEVETEDVRRPLLLLFAAVVLLLVITCGNVAMLVLSETVVRVPELATRAILGAGRVRLVRLLFVESATLACLGTLGGLGVGWWGARALLALAPSELPHARLIGLDWRVAAFAAALGAIVAIASAVAPAWALTRHDVTRGAAQRVTLRHTRLQSFVIGAQACMSVVLMTGAGLLTRSLLHQRETNPGFHARGMLSLRVDLPNSVDRNANDRLRRYADVEAALRALPDVKDVTYAMTLPLGGRVNGQNTNTRLDEKLGGPHSAEAERAVVAPNYFSMLHIPILAGRVFTAADVDSAPAVAVVSQRFARRFWPDESALGKQFRSPGGVATIVGIVGDVKNKTLNRDGEVLFYRPQAQSSARLAFVIDAPNAERIAREAQRAVWAAVPGATVSEIITLDALVERALSPARYRALLAGIFAALALLLTSVGLAGLTARAVSSRLRELCIRMALGATPRNAMGLALRRSVWSVVAGLVSGMLIAPFAAQTLSEYLYQVGERDAVTYAMTTVVALLVCGLATLGAANRLRSANLVRWLRADG